MSAAMSTPRYDVRLLRQGDAWKLWYMDAR